MGALLGLVSGVSLRTWLIIGAVAAVLFWGWSGHHQAAGLKVKLSASELSLQQERTAHLEALAKAKLAAAEEHDRIVKEQDNATLQAQAERDAALAARARAATDLGVSQRRLRNATDAARISRGASATDPAFATKCETATAAYADVLNESAARHRQLGLDADEALAASHASGVECERRYEALTKGATP